MGPDPITVVTANPLPDSFPISTFESRCRFLQAPEDLQAALGEATVLYSWRVPDTVPAETPELRFIELPSAGANHLLHHPVWKSDVTIVASTGIHAVPMAEHFFAMLLALIRQIPTIVRDQERCHWNPDLDGSHGLGELRGKTLAIIGWGKIGDNVAHLARAFGMRVVGTRRSVDAATSVPRDLSAYVDPPRVLAPDLAPDMLYPPSQIREAIGQADVILLLLPLTDDTRGSFGRTELESIRLGSLLFNLGRGGVIDEPALIDTLREGRLAGAGLDVFVEEPIPPDSPFWTMPNVIVSPHVGGNSPVTAERAAGLFALNLDAYLNGRPLLNVVDRNRGY